MKVPASLVVRFADHVLLQTADNTAGTENGGWEGQFGYGRVSLANCLLNRSRASTVGGYYGQVMDKYGRALAGAKVVCGEQSITTGASGMFRLTAISPGAHTLTATQGKLTAKADVAAVPGADTNVILQLR